MPRIDGVPQREPEQMNRYRTAQWQVWRPVITADVVWQLLRHRAKYQ